MRVFTECFKVSLSHLQLIERNSSSAMQIIFNCVHEEEMNAFWFIMTHNLKFKISNYTTFYLQKPGVVQCIMSGCCQGT